MMVSMASGVETLKIGVFTQHELTTAVVTREKPE